MHDHYLPKLLAHHPDDISAQHEADVRNKLFNIDGLGVAWYTSSNSDFERGNTGESGDGTQKEGLRPAIYKTVQPPLNDMNFRSICANTETRVCFAHIRAATSTAITPVNNHPFVFGRHAFMHNGVISDFVAIKRAMCEHISNAAYANIAGSTDSEHLAALYMTQLTSSGDKSTFEDEYTAAQMVDAMTKAVATIIHLQKEKLGSKATPNSLNLCATDGNKMVALRFRNHATEQPPSLYYSTKAGTTLNRKYPDNANGVDVPSRSSGKDEAEHGSHVIVASEPSTYRDEDWELIGKNQYVVADADRNMELRDVEYERSWDAETSNLGTF